MADLAQQLSQILEVASTSELPYLTHDVWVVMVSELNDHDFPHHYDDGGVPVYVFKTKEAAQVCVDKYNKLWLASPQYVPEAWEDEPPDGPWWLSSAGFVQ